jgi:hypothetical protein
MSSEAYKMDRLKKKTLKLTPLLQPLQYKYTTTLQRTFSYALQHVKNFKNLLFSLFCVCLSVNNEHWLTT